MSCEPRPQVAPPHAHPRRAHKFSRPLPFQGMTALAGACKARRLDVVQQLLQRNADPNITDKVASALSYAIRASLSFVLVLTNGNHLVMNRRSE